jgi:hypothetical protein
MSYDKRYQTEFNGALKPDVRKRFNKVKNELNLTLAEVGQAIAFSGAFVSTLLRDDDPAHVRTKHIERIIRGLEGLEVRAGFSTTSSSSSATASRAIGPTSSLEDLVTAAHRLGFSVEFRPLGRRS